jgi:5-methylcytosine-specific restriction enzyme subunit McrC
VADRVITIFEDYPYRLADPEAFDSATLSFLKDTVGPQNCSLEVDGTFTLKRYVGFLMHGDIRLQVLPKIFSHGQEPESTEESSASMAFLYRLLHWSGFLSHQSVHSSAICPDEGDIVEVLINVFIKEFLRVFSKTIHYDYCQHFEDQVFIKGQIIIPQTIRTSLSHPGFLHVCYDDFTIDNTLNRIFRATIRRCLTITESSENRKLLRQGLCFLEEVADIQLYSEYFSRVMLNRNNTVYMPLFRLARLFFFGLRPGFSSGSENTISILIPLNRLFERFVFSLLNDIPDIRGKVVYHSQRFLGKDSAKQDVFRIEPDFAIFDNDRAYFIADAKYKNPVEPSGGLGICAQDIYQVSIYMQRYHCRKAALIYPLFAGQRESPQLEKYSLKTIHGEHEIKIIQINTLLEDRASILKCLSESLF